MLNLENAKVFVTGAGGFIGSHLVESLVPLCGQVAALVHYDSRPEWSNLEFLPEEILDSMIVVQGDITDPHFITHAIRGSDVVFHLAALIAIPYSYMAPEAFFRTNVLGTVHVLEAARDAEVSRVVTVSTSECYGTAQFIPVNEQHPLQAQSPYSASKIGADKVVESYHRAFELPAVIVRPFNTYGPRQSARAVVPTIISQALSDMPSIQLGLLTPVRDLTYVTDTVSGLIAAARAENVEGETINLGVGKGISIEELARRILTLVGSEKEILSEELRIRPKKSEVHQLVCDNTKARSLLDWEPMVSLNEGLRRTIEFVQAYPDFYKPGKFIL